MSTHRRQSVITRLRALGMLEHAPGECNVQCGPSAVELVRSTVLQCNEAAGNFLVHSDEEGKQTVPHALIQDTVRDVPCPLENHVDESLDVWRCCLPGQQKPVNYQERWQQTLALNSVVDVLQWDGKTFAAAKMRNYIPPDMLERYGLPENFYYFWLEREDGDHNFYTCTRHTYFLTIKLAGSTAWKVVRLQTLIEWVESFIASTRDKNTEVAVTDEEFDTVLMQVFSNVGQTPANSPDTKRALSDNYGDLFTMEFPRNTRQRITFHDDAPSQN